MRVRWKAGQVALGFAGLLTLVALVRPLAPGASPRLRLAVILGLGLGVAATAFLASLRGRGAAEQFAFYGFLTLSLDGLGQVLAPQGWPIWPAMALLVAALAVAEPLAVALGVAALASLLAVADAAASSFRVWQPAVAASLAYAALVLTVNRALSGEKRRLSTTLAELARLKLGIDQLDEAVLPGSAPPSPTARTLHEVSEEGRRARQLDRVTELNEELLRLVRVARSASRAHAVLYFDVDRGREVAFLRAWDGPAAVVGDAMIPVGQDPFAFVLDRKQSFYATDFKRLLWSLPYYKPEVKIGSLLAVPIHTGGVVSGVLMADQLEIQAFTTGEPELLEAFAEMAGEAILRMRASLSREEVGAEFRAVYEISRRMAALVDPVHVRQRLIQSARDLVPLEGAAVVMVDEAQTRYVVEDALGWAREFSGREVGLSERTWAAWVLRSAEDPYLLDNLAGHADRMPILVLDEGAGRAESLLAVPLKARTRTLGALVLTGRRGSFDAAAHRVLGILANQAAATLSLIQLKELEKAQALTDGLTGLYNRRAFNGLFAKTLAQEDRQAGRFALLLLDIDHFKKLNDSYGHPAGDAALKNTARIFERHLRKGDLAARYGGEEFVAILPGADEKGALHLAERIRDAIEKGQIIFEGARIQTTASFGAAVWPADGKDADALLGAADRALYAAKQAGRNRVVAASTVPPPPPATPAL
jgi:diguanylate cyclase (GGDEF)-like protein